MTPGDLPASAARFSGRVEAYARHRPGYPAGLLPLLTDELGLEPGWTVADLGSGTGLSTRPFLDHGCRVVGVEPNPEMRGAAEALLGDVPGFRSVDGTAEATGLPDGSVDLAVAAQAFHWFDPAAARRECGRILRGARPAAIVWNSRLADADDFARGYEDLLNRFGTDYPVQRSLRVQPADLGAFFGSGFREHRLPNEQVFDLEGLRGRLLSSSYAPGPGHPDHEPMLRELERLFEEHEAGGTVRFAYETQVFTGHVPPPPT